MRARIRRAPRSRSSAAELAAVELGGQLADGAGRVACFDVGGREGLQDDPAADQMHGDVERLGDAGEEQGEEPRGARGVAHQRQLVAQRMDGGGAEIFGERLADHEAAAVGEMVGDVGRDAGDAPILAEHDREAARLDLGNRLAALSCPPHGGIIAKPATGGEMKACQAPKTRRKIVSMCLK